MCTCLNKIARGVGHSFTLKKLFAAFRDLNQSIFKKIIKKICMTINFRILRIRTRIFQFRSSELDFTF